MRIRLSIAAGLLLTLGMAGCGEGDDESAASAGSPSRASRGQALEYAQCMRDNGVPDFPDPDPADGGSGLKLPDGLDRDEVKSASAKCKHLLPNGGEAAKPDTERLEQQRAMARCMRENGVPNFPDPNPDSNRGLQVDPDKLGMEMDDPRFLEARKACAKYGPEGAKTRSAQ